MGWNPDSISYRLAKLANQSPKHSSHIQSRVSRQVFHLQNPMANQQKAKVDQRCQPTKPLRPFLQPSSRQLLQVRSTWNHWVSRRFLMFFRSTGRHLSDLNKCNYKHWQHICIWASSKNDLPEVFTSLAPKLHLRCLWNSPPCGIGGGSLGWWSKRVPLVWRKCLTWHTGTCFA